MSAHAHDGGMGHPNPVLCMRAILCTLVLELFEPYGANKPFPTGAAWNAQPLAWMLCAADTAVTASVGELYEADWTAVARQVRSAADHEMPPPSSEYGAAYAK